MRVKTRQVFVAFQRGVDDRTECRPPSERSRASAERVAAYGNVREVAAGLRTGFVNQTEVAIQKDAPFP